MRRPPTKGELSNGFRLRRHSSDSLIARASTSCGLRNAGVSLSNYSEYWWPEYISHRRTYQNEAFQNELSVRQRRAANLQFCLLNSHSACQAHTESDNVSYVLHMVQCTKHEINNSQALYAMLKSECVRHRPTTAFHPLA
jgi:hypothetical protein